MIDERCAGFLGRRASLVFGAVLLDRRAADCLTDDRLGAASRLVPDRGGLLHGAATNHARLGFDNLKGREQRLQLRRTLSRAVSGHRGASRRAGCSGRLEPAQNAAHIDHGSAFRRTPQRSFCSGAADGCRVSVLCRIGPNDPIRL
ncbi:MAG TPA: hypothetical protein VFU65_13935 [Actinocrinis sp.]|nr:hypothetical protein [Actinocrinis sp.]